jgi:hypothetical protein
VVSARPVDEYGDGNGQKLNTDGYAALNGLERRSVTNGAVAEESAPGKGASIDDLNKGQPAASWSGSLAVDSAHYLTLTPEGIAKYFAQDLPARESEILAATPRTCVCWCVRR